MNVTIIPIRARGSLLNQFQLRSGVRRAVRDAVTEGQRYMAEYPPAAPQQRYKRTGTLKRSWSSEVRESTNLVLGVVGSNSNVAPYNRDVQGPGAEQEQFFRRRGWRSVDDLVSKTERELPLRVQSEIDRAAS